VSVDETLKLMRAINEHPRWLGDLDVRYLRSQYAAEVTFVDRYLGWVLERLEKSGLRESTLVVLLSDHGEEFMEHQRWGHGRALYDELLRVPLILSLPGVLPAGRRPSAHVQLIDLSPTILDLLGIARPPVMQGRSLLPYAVLSEDVQPARPTFAKSNIQFAPKESINRANKDYDSIRFRNWKLVRFNTDRRFDEQFEFELYDLDADPGEQHDRWPTQLVVGRTLQQMLAWQHRIDESIKSQAPREGELDEGVIENLRALGYIE
jgi:arylsulfatase A-like enzyme